MGVFTYESEFSSVIPAPRLYKAFILDSDNLIPKIAPQAIKQVEILEGNGGPGTVKKITFGEGSLFKYVKHTVNSIDEEKYSYCYSMTEGDVLSNKVEKIDYTMTLVPNPDGGCTAKSVSHYHTVDGVEITEDQIKAGKEKASGLFKLVEAYLVANPDEYN